jgi:hypothetical protein
MPRCTGSTSEARYGCDVMGYVEIWLNEHWDGVYCVVFSDGGFQLAAAAAESRLWRRDLYIICRCLCR